MLNLGMLSVNNTPVFSIFGNKIRAASLNMISEKAALVSPLRLNEQIRTLNTTKSKNKIPQKAKIKHHKKQK